MLIYKRDNSEKKKKIKATAKRLCLLFENKKDERLDIENNCSFYSRPKTKISADQRMIYISLRVVIILFVL